MDSEEKIDFEIVQKITILSQISADVLAHLRHYMREKGTSDDLVVQIKNRIVVLRDDIYDIRTQEEVMVAQGKLQIIEESLKALGV